MPLDEYTLREIELWSRSIAEEQRRHRRVLEPTTGWALQGDPWIDESSPITASSMIRPQEAQATLMSERTRLLSENAARIMQREWEDFELDYAPLQEGIALESLAPVRLSRTKRVHVGMKLLAEAEKKVREHI